MNLRETRQFYNLSQAEVADILNVPIRTYRRYEIDDNYGDKFKRGRLIDMINKKFEISEEKGLLTIEHIKKTIIPVLKRNNIYYCYLFGSYAKGNPRENSDVDLLIDTDASGLSFLNLIEEFRMLLHKKVDLLRLKDIKENNPIALEILKEGIKILWSNLMI